MSIGDWRDEILHPDPLAYARSDLADAVEAIPEQYRAQAIAWVQYVYVDTKYSPEKKETPIMSITAPNPPPMTHAEMRTAMVEEKQFHTLSEYIAYAEHPDRLGKPSGEDKDGDLFRVCKSGDDVFYLETQRAGNDDWTQPDTGARMPITAIDPNKARNLAESKLLAAEAEFLTEMGWIPHAPMHPDGPVTWSHTNRGGLYSQRSAIKEVREGNW